MTRAARSLALLAVVVASGACSYEAGELSQPTSGAPRSTVAPTTTLAGPVVGTLPPITAPGQTLPPPVTAPPETSPPPTEAPPPEPEPPSSVAGTVEESSPPTEAPAPTTTAAKVPTAVYLGVQAGAFSDLAAAEGYLAQLQAKGFGAFALKGSGPYRVVAIGFTATQAEAMVAKLAGAGFPGLVFQTKG